MTTFLNREKDFDANADMHAILNYHDPKFDEKRFELTHQQVLRKTTKQFVLVFLYLSGGLAKNKKDRIKCWDDSLMSRLTEHNIDHKELIIGLGENAWEYVLIYETDNEIEAVHFKLLWG